MKAWKIQYLRIIENRGFQEGRCSQMCQQLAPERSRKMRIDRHCIWKMVAVGILQKKQKTGSERRQNEGAESKFGQLLGGA